MDSRKYDELEKMLCNELEEVIDKGELTAGSLDIVDKLTHSLKNVYKIKMGYDGEYSNSYARGNYSRDGYSRDGYSRDGYSKRDSYDNSYDSDSYGMHWVRGHYSRDDGKQMIVEEMRKAINDQGMSSPDRHILEKAMKILQ
jgi:hypothetical protein